jgi:hypothetical protein
MFGLFRVSADTNVADRRAFLRRKLFSYFAKRLSLHRAAHSHFVIVHFKAEEHQRLPKGRTN